MRFGRWSAMLGAPLLFGCDAPTRPLLVDGAQRFDPPPVYHLWWDLTQECSGRRAPLADVRWYYVPGAQTLTVNGRHVEGYWTAPGNTIVLAEAAMLRGPLVRHEMLHSLQETTTHPREFFLSRCGGVVWCDGACADEAEPLPPANPALARVEPDALEIGVEIRPAQPSRGTFGGYFTMTVTARNPRGDSVMVMLPQPGDGGPGPTFSYSVDQIEGPFGYLFDDRAWDAGATRFAAGEVKRRVFDFHIIDEGWSTADGALSPGIYRFDGAYGRRWAASVTITIP